jgi:UDP-glucose 4-epimerase
MAERLALVTGAHGAIGRYVARKLADDGWRVIGVGHGLWEGESAADTGLAAWHNSDVTLQGLLATCVRPDAIVHCAGSGAVAASLTAPYEDFQRTVGTTAAVLEFMRVACPGAALVYPSSAAVYGVAQSLPIVESAPLAPVSPYGLHKKVAEELVAMHAGTFGRRAAVVRLFSIYGEGFRKQLLWDACRRIRSNESQFFGTGDETRDWLHASDAAALLVRAIDCSSTACPVVNGAAGVPTRVREVLEELFRHLGRSDVPTFCGTERPGDPVHYHADVERALAWGWRPTVTWQQGLRRYAQWFQHEGFTS